jgi:hypothetical protein
METYQTYRFEILKNGVKTPDTMRATGRSENEARDKASKDPDLGTDETIGARVPYPPAKFKFSQ